jgi:NAD(P)-dependent dehydrogenase (short-subunit alcohol dehydrogenase family)
MKTWFITGTSRGFGREWAIAALDRGDKVAATARDTASLDDLVAKYGDAILPIKLDVTDRAADFSSAQHSAELPAYAPVREKALAARKARFNPGVPSATREAILTLVDTENPPLRLFLGEAPLGIATADYESRLAAWREWQPVAAAAQGKPQQ